MPQIPPVEKILVHLDARPSCFLGSPQQHIWWARTPNFAFRESMDSGVGDGPAAAKKQCRIRCPKSLLLISLLVYLDARPSRFLGLPQQHIQWAETPNFAFWESMDLGVGDGPVAAKKQRRIQCPKSLLLTSLLAYLKQGPCQIGCIWNRG